MSATTKLANISHALWMAAESELDEAKDHIRYLLPLAKGYVAAHPGIKSTADIVAQAEAFVASSPPPEDKP